MRPPGRAGVRHTARHARPSPRQPRRAHGDHAAGRHPERVGRTRPAPPAGSRAGRRHGEQGRRRDHRQRRGARTSPRLARAGASFTDAHAETHPSQPNYLALFSGAHPGRHRQRLRPPPHRHPTSARPAARVGTHVHRLLRGPPAGRLHGVHGGRATRASTTRGSNFTDLARRPATNLPASTVGPRRTAAHGRVRRCPTCATTCTTATSRPVTRGRESDLGSLRSRGQARTTACSCVTFDESETRTRATTIATVLAGPMVTPGRYRQRIDHYSLLRTHRGHVRAQPARRERRDRNPITDIWRTPLTTAPEAPASRR